MPSYYGLIFIFLSSITYASCIVFSLVNLVYYGYFSLLPLIISQTFAHVFLLVGIFIARDEIARAKYNPVVILKKSLEVAAPSLQFFLLFSGIMLMVSLMQGHNVVFEGINALIYLNLYLLYGKR